MDCIASHARAVPTPARSRWTTGFGVSPVIVLRIHEFHILPDEAERHPPIAVDPHGPMTGQVALKLVHPKSRDREIGRRLRHIQHTQDASELRRVRGLHPSRIASRYSHRRSRQFVPPPAPKSSAVRAITRRKLRCVKKPGLRVFVPIGHRRHSRWRSARGARTAPGPHRRHGVAHRSRQPLRPRHPQRGPSRRTSPPLA